ncbi:MAG: hypothetical protein WDM85_15230 [Caulobacteraceae bacterium]
MNDLLASAIDAHGGLDRWNSFTKLRAEVSIDGAIWRIKQQPGLLLDKLFEIETHAQRVTITPFSGPDRRSAFVPDRLAIETLDGELIEARENPETDFEGAEVGGRLGQAPRRLLRQRSAVDLSHLAIPIQLPGFRERRDRAVA